MVVGQEVARRCRLRSASVAIHPPAPCGKALRPAATELRIGPLIALRIVRLTADSPVTRDVAIAARTPIRWTDHRSRLAVTTRFPAIRAGVLNHPRMTRFDRADR